MSSQSTVFMVSLLCGCIAALFNHISLTILCSAIMLSTFMDK